MTFESHRHRISRPIGNVHTTWCMISYVCTTISCVSLRYRMSTYDIVGYQESRLMMTRMAGDRRRGPAPPDSDPAALAAGESCRRVRAISGCTRRANLNIACDIQVLQLSHESCRARRRGYTPWHWPGSLRLCSDSDPSGTGTHNSTGLQCRWLRPEFQVRVRDGHADVLRWAESLIMTHYDSHISDHDS